MLRYSAPNAITCRSPVNPRMNTGANSHAKIVRTAITTEARPIAENRMPYSIGATPAEVLADHGRDREAQSHYRQKHRLHDARAHAEACLGCRAELPDDYVNDEHID